MNIKEQEENIILQVTTIYIEVEWSSKATWKKPMSVARDFVEHIAEKDKDALECFEDDCEINFSTSEEFANALSGRMVCAETR